MKRIFIFLLLSFTCSMVNAEWWDKNTLKVFHKEKLYGLVVDMANAKMADLDSAKFVVYIAGKEGKTLEYYQVVFNKFREELRKSLEKHTKKSFVLGDKCKDVDFCFLYKVRKITECAGMEGELYIVYKGDMQKARVYDFVLEDGRWNSFDNLFLEAAEELGKRIRQLDSWNEYDLDVRKQYYRLKE